MAYSTTAITRTVLIEGALKKAGILAQGISANANQLADGVNALNLIMLNINGADPVKWRISGTPYGIKLDDSRSKGIFKLAPNVLWVESASYCTVLANSLANPTLTNGTSWSVSGDFSLASNTHAAYTDATHVGTLYQAAGSMTTPGVVDGWYLLWFYLYDVVGRPVLYVSGDTALTPVRIPMATGTFGVIFQWGLAANNFILSVTSSIAGDAFKLDNIYLHKLYDVDSPIYPLTFPEFSSLSSKVGPGDPQYYTLDENEDPPNMVVTPIPSVGSGAPTCIRYYPKVKMDLLDDAADQIIEVPQSYFRFFEYQLAADLAAEYGRPLDLQMHLYNVAKQALDAANSSKRTWNTAFIGANKPTT